MAASATDKFIKAAKDFTTAVGAGGVADASVTTVPLVSVTGLPTDTAVQITIDRVDANGTSTPSKKEVITGVVSSTNLIDCVRGVEGTAQAHAAGAVVEVMLTAAQWNSMIDAMIAGHGQTGEHGEAAVSVPTHDATDKTTPVDADEIPIVDSEASNILKKLTWANLKETLFNTPTITKPVLNSSVQGVQTYTPNAGGTATLNLALANVNVITMPAGNITIALSNATVGQIFTIDITQDSVGSRTVTWFSTIRWAGGSAPILTTTLAKRDSFIFKCTGANTYDGYIIGVNI